MVIWLIGWGFTMALTDAPFWGSLVAWPGYLGTWAKDRLNKKD